MSVRVVSRKAKDATDKELRFDHNLMHHAYKKLSRGRSWGDLTKEQVIERHATLVDEFRKRSLTHQVTDRLDNTLKMSVSNFFDVLREFRVRSPFVSVLGGFSNWEVESGKIDFMLGTAFDGNIVATRTIDVLAERAGDFSLHIQDSKFVTPFSNHVPLYNLKLKFVDKLQLERSGEPSNKAYKSVSEFITQIGDGDVILFDDFVNFVPIGDINKVERIDVYFSVELSRDMALPIEFRIFRQFPREYWSKFAFHYKEPPDDAIPYFALVLERINTGDRVFANSIPPLSQLQANETIKGNRISFGKFFHPLKTSLSPLHASRREDLFSIEPAIQFLRRVAKREEMEEETPIVFVEKKYDGLRCIISRNEDEVKIFTDSGLDKTWRFPSLVKELRATTSPRKFILDTECEGWINGRHLDREVVSGYVNASSSPNDSHIIFNVFDILAYSGQAPEMIYEELQMIRTVGMDGWREQFTKLYQVLPNEAMRDLDEQDLHECPYQLRRKLLSQLPFKQSVIDVPNPEVSHLNLVTSQRCDAPDITRRALKRSLDALASEGAMIKSYDSIYPLKGTTADWVKLKKEIELKVVVWRKHKTAKKGIYNYDVAVSFLGEDNVNPRRVVTIGKKRYLHIGRTYNTEVDANPGTTIKIRFYNLNLYEDVKTNEKYLNIYGASLHEVRHDDFPDNLHEAIEVGRSSGLLHEKLSRSVAVHVEKGD